MHGDFSAAEVQAHTARLMAILSMAARQQQWAAEQLSLFGAGPSPRAPFPPHGRAFPAMPPSATNGAFHALFGQNPLMAAMAAASMNQQQHQFASAAHLAMPPPANTNGSGIFPAAGGANGGFVPPRPFPPLPTAQQQQSQIASHHTEAESVCLFLPENRIIFPVEVPGRKGPR